MQIIQTFSQGAQICLYILLALLGLYSLLIFGWQIMVLRGNAMKNPDGSSDDYHEQKTHFGIAFADVYLACPTSFTGIILVFIYPRWGFSMLGMVAFWFIWANLMTTATSLRFEKPKLTLSWWITYPAEIIVGLAYIIWLVIQFNTIYS